MTSTQQSVATDLGTAFITALAGGDFHRLADTLTTDVRLRALIPRGLVELSGAKATAAKLSSWFGEAELELLRSRSEATADRLHISYQLRVKKRGEARKLVEQHLLCTLDGDRVSAVDLVCTGFRPDDAAGPPSMHAAAATELDERPAQS